MFMQYQHHALSMCMQRESVQTADTKNSITLQLPRNMHSWRHHTAHTRAVEWLFF